MDETLFTRGDLVRHKRLGYRGAVYEVEPNGKKEDSWPPSSTSLEENQETWYRILVDNAQHSCRLAEHELTKDSSRDPIKNPKLDQYFQDFENGKYQPRVI
ncbi:MAG: heat shock protein HspQ [Planctomycetota bacterium]|nr:heat shock protein HspQ [Planctomycetota bacterium]